MLRYCANLKAIRYESTNLNRIVADKSHREIVALHNNVASLQKNRGDKSHRVIVALGQAPPSFDLDKVKVVLDDFYWEFYRQSFVLTLPFN